MVAPIPSRSSGSKLPPRAAGALRVLQRLGAIERTGTSPRVTALGRQLQRIPLHPRLARILLDGRAAPQIVAACALLAEPLSLDANAVSTSCDLLPLIDRFERQPYHVRQVAEELRRIAGAALDGNVASRASEEELRHALFTAYADRLAKRRSGTIDRLALATGHGATLTRESGVRDGDYLVALDVVAGERDGIAESRIRAASRVEPEWITPTSIASEHRLDRDSDRVRAWRVARFDEIVLSETPATPDRETAVALLRDAWLEREPDARTVQLLRRRRVARLE